MPKRRTAEKKTLFLEAVERGLSVVAAAEHAGIDRTLPYVWEQQDEGFEERWEKARESRFHQLKDTAFDIALVERDKGMIKFLYDRFSQGEQQGQTPIREIEIIMPGESDGNPDFISIG